MSKTIQITLAILALFSTHSYGQSRTQNGATVGGVAGAVIGGIIGKQNDETPEGVLIGGAVGAIAGGLLGKAQDNELERQRYAQQQAYYAQQQQNYLQQQAIAQSGVSMADVVSMVRSGVSDPLIMTQLQTKGVQRRLEVSDIISLHQQGVSDNLITAVQSAPLANQINARPIPSPVQQSPVIVQQPSVIVSRPPVYYSSPIIVESYSPYPVYRHHHHHSGSFGGSVRIGF